MGGLSLKQLQSLPRSIVESPVWLALVAFLRRKLALQVRHLDADRSQGVLCNPSVLHPTISGPQPVDCLRDLFLRTARRIHLDFVRRLATLGKKPSVVQAN